MSSVVEVTLQRTAGSGAWGLRLQGGIDFEKTLLISHVTEGSPSHVSGLMVRKFTREVQSALLHKKIINFAGKCMRLLLRILCRQVLVLKLLKTEINVVDWRCGAGGCRKRFHSDDPQTSSRCDHIMWRQSSAVSSEEYSHSSPGQYLETHGGGGGVTSSHTWVSGSDLHQDQPRSSSST